MFKKIIIFILALFFTAPVTLADDSSDLLAVTAMYIKNGLITNPNWTQSIDWTKAFSQYDTQGKELARFFISSYEYMDKNDNKGFNRFNDYIYDGEYISVRDLNQNGKTIALYKLSGNTIYQYDNNPDPKPGLLGVLGFYEKGPGHLVSTAKIINDGSLCRFDKNGDLIASLKFSNNKTIQEFDADGQKTGYYKLFCQKEVFPDKTPSSIDATITNNSQAVVAVLVLLAKAGIIKNNEWADALKFVNAIYCYNQNKSKTGRFSSFGSDVVDQFDESNSHVANFSTFSGDVYYYDGHKTKLGSFSMFGDDIYQYDKNNAEVGHYSFWGTDLYQYDRDYKKIGSFSIFGSSISQYDRYGKKIAEFDLF